MRARAQLSAASRSPQAKGRIMGRNLDLSRRGFIGAAGSAAALGVMGLAGCGSQRASEVGSAEGGSAGAATLTYGVRTESLGLDPALASSDPGTIMSQMYEGLLKFNDDCTDVVPCLAEDWSVSEDGLTYTFKLREGVKFHDGTDFNADAVVRSIDRQLEPNRTDEMAYASFVFGSEDSGTGVESVEKTGDYEVVLHMRAASTPFKMNLAMLFGAPIVSPTALDEYDNNLNEHPCGTGPYKFVSWDKGENVQMETFEDYWDKDNMPKCSKIVYRFIPEPASRVTALTNGEVDIIDGVDPAMIEEVEGAGCVGVIDDASSLNYMAFNTEEGAFADVEARRAFCQAVNIEEMVETLYGDYSTVAHSCMPESMAPYAQDIERPSYDPDAAREAFEKLGITKVSMLTYTNAQDYNVVNGQNLAETIQGYLAEVGVEMDIAAYDLTTYKTRQQTDKYDVCLAGWLSDNGDPDNFMNLLATDAGTQNIAHYSNPDYDELIVKGITTPAGEERDEVYRQCEEIAAEDLPWMVISHGKSLGATSASVQGYTVNPLSFYDAEFISKQA